MQDNDNTSDSVANMRYALAHQAEQIADLAGELDRLSEDLDAADLELDVYKRAFERQRNGWTVARSIALGRAGESVPAWCQITSDGIFWESMTPEEVSVLLPDEVPDTPTDVATSGDDDETPDVTSLSYDIGFRDGRRDLRHDRTWHNTPDPADEITDLDEYRTGYRDGWQHEEGMWR